jgi:hypothetical protein
MVKEAGFFAGSAAAGGGTIKITDSPGGYLSLSANKLSFLLHRREDRFDGGRSNGLKK